MGEQYTLFDFRNSTCHNVEDGFNWSKFEWGMMRTELVMYQNRWRKGGWFYYCIGSESD